MYVVTYNNNVKMEKIKNHDILNSTYIKLILLTYYQLIYYIICKRTMKCVPNNKQLAKYIYNLFYGMLLMWCSISTFSIGGTLNNKLNLLKYVDARASASQIQLTQY